MKSLFDYITESESTVNQPRVGDAFALKFGDDCLIETHIVESLDNAVVIHADERTMQLLEEHGCTMEEIRRYGAVGNSPGMGYSVNEHGGGIGPKKRWQDMMELGEVYDLDREYGAPPPEKKKRSQDPDDHNPYPFSPEEDDDYFREIFRKKREAKDQGMAEGYQLDEGAVETITALVKKIPGIGKYYQLAQQYKPQLIQILKTSKSGKEVKQKMEQLVAQQPAPVAESGLLKQLGGLAVGGGSILSTMWMNAMGMIDGVLAHATAGEIGGAVASGSILGLIPVTLMLFAAMLLFKGSKQSSDEKAQAVQAQRGQQGMAEGEGNLGKALDTLSGNWSGWHQVKSRNPNIEKFEWDDGEGGFYAGGSIEHNLKTGEVTVDYHGEYDDEVKGTFKNMGDAMRALRGDGGSHGGQAPNFDRLRDRKPPGPDDLRKTDRTGRKGTIGGGHANQLKGSIQANKGRLGPKGVLPEAGPRAVDDQGNPIEKSKGHNSVSTTITPDQLKSGGSYSTHKGVVTKTDTGLIHKARSSVTPTPKGVEEGRMNNIDIERQDYERMNPVQFKKAYGMSRDEWYAKNKALLDPKQTSHDKLKEFKRMMELAGVADHKYNKEDDVYSEDQSAGVLAQKELANQVTEPMPGVHEDGVDPVNADGEDAEELSGNMTAEADYHGREVQLNKPMAGDVKKSKVYVKDPKTGNIKKVNFGDKTMRIKKSIPARRKSFRARHHCENPGPKTKARYWSCRAW